MDGFYAPPENIRGDTLRLEGSEFHHLARVMRKQPGDEIFVTAGDGIMYRAEVREIGKGDAVCAIVERLPGFNEPATDIVLVQAVLKNPGKMDLIVEKATELGASRIVPVHTAFTVAKGGKPERWRALALAAMKQCNRCRLPQVDGVRPFEEAVPALAVEVTLVCHEGEHPSHPLERFTGEGVPASVAVYIGPEGGFSAEELALLEAAGARRVSLGARRLRSETAAVAALARLTAAVEQPGSV